METDIGVEAHPNGEVTERMYVDHFDFVVGMILSYSSTLHDEGAADVAQTVFEKVLRIADRYDPNLGSEKKWLATIARSMTMNVFRSKARNSQNSWSDLDPEVVENLPLGQNVEQEVMARLQRDQVLSALASINPSEAKLLYDMYFLDKSPSEIAQERGLSPNAVRIRLSRARASFRNQLALEDFE